MKSETKYIIKVHIGIMDNTITSIDKMFLGNKNIYNVFVYLSSSILEDLLMNKLSTIELYKPTVKINYNLIRVKFQKLVYLYL